MVLNSKPSSTFNHISIVRYYVLLVLISLKSSNGNIISITRLPNQDDSFDVLSHQGLLCPPNTCSRYKADQKLSGISDSCLCQCPSPLSTFYSKTYTCLKNKDIVDQNRCSNIKFKGTTLGILPVIDILSTPGSLPLENKMDGSCSKIKSSWLYLKNGTWHMGKNGIISVTLKQHWIHSDQWLLNWYSGLHSNYSGIIIKVVVTCEHDNILDHIDNRCLMFKSQGTFQVKQTNIIPTTIPQTSTTATPKPSQTTRKAKSSTEYQPTQTTAFTTKTKVMSTSTVQPTTAIPKKDPRKEDSGVDQKLWIAFAAGGVTIFFVVIGSLVFFLLMCRQRKKHTSRTEIEGQSSTRTQNGNDPLHDYEYVVYPVLTEGYQSSSARSLDNAMYGRGPDNELIIRTPGISMESLATNSINHTRDGYYGNKRSSSAYYPRDISPLNHIVNNMSNTIGNSSHEYAQLQRKEDDVVDSTGIYQPLIRPVTPDSSDDRPEKKQAIPLEPIDNNATTIPDYMVLEPDDFNEQDLSA
ncbi:uncharacterized protein LOC116297670 [Actinia tenebrosa]|uniref:Uncharacterized protein LOC116297670 n=1 Tax=Actinia tenebrosa TaxID=6105 RepID=A0A6P8I1Y2_ACTTE|nr:uncharacterized protein LOC116297670 [Actinia tenebrosa]